MGVTPVQSTVAVVTTGAVKNSTNAVGSTATASVATGDAYSSSIAKIAAKYDPSNIQLSQVPDFANELVKNNLVSALEGVSMICQAKEMQKTSGSGASVNLLQYEHQQLESAKIFGKEGQLAAQQQTVDVLETISGTHSSETSAARTAYETGIASTTVDPQHIMSVLEALTANRKDA
jgi:hypothetical protein